MCGIAGWIDHSQYMSERIDLLNRMSETCLLYTSDAADEL